MATKWVGSIVCAWCSELTRVGIEKDGKGRTYRLICDSCGMMGQVAFHYPAGQKITALLQRAPGTERGRSHEIF